MVLKKMTFVAQVILLLLVTITTTIQGCPDNCRCSTTPMVMDCIQADTTTILTTIPTIPNAAVQVILDNNRISTIDENDFQNTGESLVYLSMENNSITSIGQNAFGHVTNLLVLSLSRNSINRLDQNMFTGLNKTSVLNMDNNNIAGIECGTFALMESLQYLRFAQNSLTSVASCTFMGLSQIVSLDLSNNKLTQISSEAFENMQHLKNLHLNNNFLVTLSAEWFAGKQLAVVTLSGNPWLCDCGSYTTIQEAMESGPETNCRDDNMCVVCNNPPRYRLVTFTTINESMWQECDASMLTTLPLTNIERDTEILTTNEQRSTHKVVRSISRQILLSDTTTQKEGVLRCDPTNTSCGLAPNQNITYILKQNIPLKLQQLTLAHNLFQFINVTDFHDIVNLTNLQLSFNIISNIDDFSFMQNNKLNTLNLDNNRLTTINVNTFAGLSGLVNLHLQNNRITTNLTAGIFQHLTSLEGLYLSGNQISQIDDCAFCNITSIINLELNNNSISVLQKDAFKGLTGLATLSVSHNQITQFDFTVLRGNPFRTLLTEGNNWVCDCAMKTMVDSLNGTFPIPCVSVGIGNLCIQCATPNNLAGLLLNTLPRSNVSGCELTTTAATTNSTITTTSSTSATTPVTITATNITTTAANSTVLPNQTTNPSPATAVPPTSNMTATLQNNSTTTTAKANTPTPGFISRKAQIEKILYIVIPVVGGLLLVIAIALIYVTFVRKPLTRTPAQFGSSGRYEPSNAHDQTHVPLEVLNVFENSVEDKTEPK
ncbi:uncharacterized protein LOC108949610 [Ciona intestinalis]